MPSFGVADTTTEDSSFAFSGSNGSQGSRSVAFPEDGTLDSVDLYYHKYSAGANYDIRIGVWIGGPSDTDFTGATLVWDSGKITPKGSVGVPAWHNHVISGSPALSSGDRVWVVIKGYWAVTWYGVLSDESEDVAPHDMLLEAALGGDETVAFSTQSPAAASGADFGSGTAFKWRLNYTAGGGGGGIAMPLVMLQHDHFSGGL